MLGLVIIIGTDLALPWRLTATNTMPSEPTISAALIVKNEADVLAGCLESLAGAADEIVIVDTGSTDDTIEIARRFTDKVYKSELFNADTKLEDFHFGDARNEALDRCTCDWVLSIDADEVLHDTSLRAHLGDADFREACVSIFGHGTNEMLSLRLLKNDGHTRWRGRCHETFFTERQQTSVLESVCCIEHLANGEDDQRVSCTRNLAMLVQQATEIRDAKDSRMASMYQTTLAMIGESFGGLRRFYEAIGYLSAALEGFRGGLTHNEQMVTHCAQDLALCFAEIGCLGAAERYAKEVWSRDPGNASAGAIMASAQMARGHYGDAKLLLEGIVTAAGNRCPGGRLTVTPFHQSSVKLLATCNERLAAETPGADEAETTQAVQGAGVTG